MIRRRRRPKVARLARRGAIDALVAALAHEEWVVTSDGRRVDLGAPLRVEAVHALGAVTDGRAAEALERAAMSDRDPSVRAAAIGGLDIEARPAAADALARLALTPRESVPVTSAAEAVLRACPAAAAAAVTRALLAGVGDGAKAQLLLAELARVTDTAPLLALLIDAMRAGPVEPATTAVVLLGPAGVPPLLAALDDPGTAAGALTALGRLGDQRAIDPLTRSLGDAQPEVRRAAVEALGRLGDPRSAPALLAAADDDDYHVRVAAAKAVEGLGASGLLAAVAMAVRASAEDRSLGGPDRDADAIAAALLSRMETRVRPRLASAAPDREGSSTAGSWTPLLDGLRRTGTRQPPHNDDEPGEISPA